MSLTFSLAFANTFSMAPTGATNRSRGSPALYDAGLDG
jgi:hypothetical protein